MHTECAICLENLIGKVCILNCNHLFHLECIKQVKKSIHNNHNLCPFCRQRLKIKSILNFYFEEGQIEIKNSFCYSHCTIL